VDCPVRSDGVRSRFSSANSTKRGGWDTGFSSCAGWLTWRTGLDPGAARERVRVARALPSLPRIAQALARGELSYSKIRALTRVATPETEERLLAIGREGTAKHVERIRPRLATAGPHRRSQRGHAGIEPESCACITTKTAWW
jgi:Domain of unknown function (DUF222)